MLLIICYLVYNINGEDFGRNDTIEEALSGSGKFSISIRDMFGILSGIIVLTPPIIVVIFLLTYQRESIKVGKVNKYYRLKTVNSDSDNPENRNDSVIYLPNEEVPVELTKF
uniref:PIR Superfamily Protein n=1 Tax=Strongyloides stercoralis TaxID=6248 RepID=A0A0K0EF85_STRER